MLQRNIVIGTLVSTGATNYKTGEKMSYDRLIYDESIPVSGRKIDMLVYWANAEGMDAETGALFIRDKYRRSKSYIATQILKFHGISNVERINDKYIDWVLAHADLRFTGRGIRQGANPKVDPTKQFNAKTTTQRIGAVFSWLFADATTWIKRLLVVLAVAAVLKNYGAL